MKTTRLLFFTLLTFAAFACSNKDNPDEEIEDIQAEQMILGPWEVISPESIRESEKYWEFLSTGEIQKRQEDGQGGYVYSSTSFFSISSKHFYITPRGIIYAGRYKYKYHLTNNQLLLEFVDGPAKPEISKLLFRRIN